LLRVSGGASILKEDLSDEGINHLDEGAVRLNASEVSISVFVGAPTRADAPQPWEVVGPKARSTGCL